MKSINLWSLFSCLLFFTQTAFSQSDDGNYAYSNEKGMICNLIVNDGGSKVSIQLNMGSVSPNKILKGEGLWREQNGMEWYEISTDLCNISFDKPADKIKIEIYDCKKNSNLSPSKYILSRSSKIQTNLQNVKAKVPTSKYKDWGKKPIEQEEGPADMWTMPGQMCEAPSYENVKASTTLAPQGKYKYLASYVCDDDPTTAWVEGNADYGIGEFLEIKDWIPMGNGEISILNGYQSSKTAWENNSRVKKFKVSINGKDFCVLELADVMGVQIFKLPANNGGTFRFTIIEVFSGLKWKDTSISGIFSCGG